MVKMSRVEFTRFFTRIFARILLVFLFKNCSYLARIFKKMSSYEEFGTLQVLHGHPDHVQAAHLQQRHPQPAAEGAGAAGQEERARQVPAARPRADREGVGADVEEELREQRHHS